MNYGEYVNKLRVRHELANDFLAKIAFRVTLFGYPVLILFSVLLDHCAKNYDVEYFITISNFIPSLAELLSVVIGFTMAYAVERAHKELLRKKANKKILLEIRDELNSNREQLTGLYASGGRNYIKNLLSTKTWDIYEDLIGEKVGWRFTPNLCEIYKKIELLNEIIMKYPTYEELTMAKIGYAPQLGLEIKENITKFSKFITEYYEKEYDPKEKNSILLKVINIFL